MSNMFARIAFGAILFTLAILISTPFFFKGSGSGTGDSAKDNSRISIVATIYPLAYLAKDLDSIADITTIVGPGLEPHDYEPTIQDVKAIQSADLFLTVRGIDEWAINAITERRGPTVDVAESLNLLSEGFDPHVWLDPVYAQEIVRKIGEQLRVIDPMRAGEIKKNVQAKVAELERINTAYAAGLSSCALHDVVTAHDAFGYLGKRYDITFHSITGISPDAEPTPSTIADIVDLIRVKKLPTVFFEPMSGEALAQTLANEANVATGVLDPIESELPESSTSSGYTERMMNNLEALQGALVCRT